MTCDLWFDLETYSTTPIKDGSWRYAEAAEIMLWAYALDDGQIKVWDRANSRVHWEDELSGLWESAPCVGMPVDLDRLIGDPGVLVWGHNSTMFDFPVMQHAMPGTAARISFERRRDTMVQAYCHGLPGGLDMLGAALNISEDKRKLKRGKALVQLFCKPHKVGDELVRYTRETHPVEWQEFIQYAGGDIVTMREAHRKMPNWNYKGKQLELAILDAKINARGFAIDRELATAAVRAAAEEKARLAAATQEMTGGEVQAATQRDALLAHIMKAHGVDLPDMLADTLERRVRDPDLPDAVRELLVVRLQASMNSVSKFNTLLKGVNSDGRLRGGAQFRGAFRTGRWAHRLFQHGNMPRMDPEAIARWFGIAVKEVKEKHVRQYVESGIASILLGCEDLTHGEVMRLCSMVIRGVIVAPKGKKLVVADLSNIEGRVAAWLAGEEWLLQAFRDYDTIVGHDGAKDEPIRKGADLYKLTYAKAFQVPVDEVGGFERQIGKVLFLFFVYGGGVGAFITGAATYGIDLEKMADAAWDTLPADVVEEARSFLGWKYGSEPQEKFDKRIEKGMDEGAALALLETDKLAARLGLTERVFITCDSLKRLWRRANLKIVAIWGDLEDAMRAAILSPSTTYNVRGLKIRRDGGWLRIGLPSGRCLCYPSPKLGKDGKTITYMGLNQYSRKWERLSTYGAKTLEQCTQATACDQLAECMPIVEEAGYPIVFHVHDEDATEVPDDPKYSADELAKLMCSDLGWNRGLPLAAAGFETYRYEKG